MGERRGCCLSILVGVIGALLGGLLITLLAGESFTWAWGFNLRSFVVAVLGAVLFLGILRAFRGRPRW
jgi:uncharacterized membrane protein YeaQ/YmgE (transglycosylase-associated protein family)